MLRFLVKNISSGDYEVYINSLNNIEKMKRWEVV